MAQRGLVHQPPQQPVQQREALRVAVQHHRFAQRAGTTRGTMAVAARGMPLAARLVASPGAGCGEQVGSAALAACPSAPPRAAPGAPAASRGFAAEARRDRWRWTRRACMCGPRLLRTGRPARARRQRAASVGRVGARAAGGRPAPRRAAPCAAARAGAAGRRCAAGARARASSRRSTAFTPRPGTRSSSSRGARFRSTGKRSRMRQRPGQLGVDVERQHAVRGRRRDLVGLEAVEAHQPVGLVQPVLAHQRRRLQRQRRGGIGDRAEGRVVDALEPVGAVQLRAGAPGWCASSVASAPTIICVLWPAGANCGAAARRARAPRHRRRSAWRRRLARCALRVVDVHAQPRHRALDGRAVLLAAPALPGPASVGSSMLIDSRSA